MTDQKTRIEMFAVMVKHAARKRICTSGLVWVKDDHHEFYVSMKERGLWPTKAEAERMITEPWEIAVEVHNAGVTGAELAKRPREKCGGKLRAANGGDAK